MTSAPLPCTTDSQVGHYGFTGPAPKDLDKVNGQPGQRHTHGPCHTKAMPPNDEVLVARFDSDALQMARKLLFVEGAALRVMYQRAAIRREFVGGYLKPLALRLHRTEGSGHMHWCDLLFPRACHSDLLMGRLMLA